MDRRMILSAATIVALIALVTGGLALGVRQRQESLGERLDRATDLFRQGKDLDAARAIAIEMFTRRDELPYEQYAIPSYLLGRIVQGQVEGVPPSAPRSRALRLAGQHLQQALLGDLPEELARDARRQLALIRAETGTPDEAAAALDVVLAEEGDDDDLEATRIEIELARPTPDFDLVARLARAIVDRTTPGSPVRRMARSLVCDAAIRAGDRDGTEASLAALAGEPDDGGEPAPQTRPGGSDDDPAAEDPAPTVVDGGSRIPALVAFHRAQALWAGVIESPEAITRQGHLDAALRDLDGLTESDLSPARAGQAVLLRGLILADLDREQEALSVFSRLAAAAPGDQLVAALRAVEIAIRRDDPALQEPIDRLVRALADPAAVGHPFLSARDLGQRVLALQDALLKARQFPAASALAEGAGPAVGPDIRDRLRAVAELLWATAIDPSLLRTDGEAAPLADVIGSVGLQGRSTDATAATGPPDRAVSPAERAEARAHLRLAAKALDDLAALRFDRPEHPEDLFAAGLVSLTAEDFPTSVDRFTAALPQAPGALVPRILAARGEAFREVGLFERAEADLISVVRDWPEHPATLAARNLLAELYSLEGRVPEALGLLEDNLYRSNLSPRSAEWRTSLFLFGEIRFREAAIVWSRLQQDYWAMTDAQRAVLDVGPLREAAEAHMVAVSTLSEAARRFPDDPRSGRAWYLTGEAYRRQAVALGHELDRTVVPVERLQLQSARGKPLLAAIAAYEAAESALDPRRRTNRGLASDGVAARTLRNARCARASVLFESGRYDDAAQVYAEIAAAGADEPLALEALLRVARCLREEGQKDAAQTKLQQAALLFDRIRETATFPGLSRYPADDWDRLLTLLAPDLPKTP